VNIRELEELTGQPARLIRYLISEGLVPPPEGVTRGATYDQRHVDALRRYAAMKARGITSLDVIKASMADGYGGEEVITPVDGLEIRIGAQVRGLDPEVVIQKVRDALAAALRKPNGGENQ